jgi:hypothetical protein
MESPFSAPISSFGRLVGLMCVLGACGPSAGEPTDAGADTYHPPDLRDAGSLHDAGGVADTGAVRDAGATSDAGASDAEVAPTTCPRRADSLPLFADAIAASGGTAWQWSHDHYVASSVTGIELSEIWWPWMLPGANDVVVSTSAPFRSRRRETSPAGVPSWLSDEPMVAWTGTIQRGLLLGGSLPAVPRRDVYLLDEAHDGVLLVARLPTDPRLPVEVRPTQEQQENPPHSYAGLLENHVVWLAENGDIWATRLSDGASSVVQSSTNADVLVAAGDQFAWRSDGVVFVRALSLAEPRSFVVGDRTAPTRQAVALNHNTLFVGVADVVRAIPLSSEGLETEWRVDDEVARIAVDECFIYATFGAPGRRSFVAWPLP